MGRILRVLFMSWGNAMCLESAEKAPMSTWPQDSVSLGSPSSATRQLATQAQP